jgi:hypothetical protein
MATTNPNRTMNQLQNNMKSIWNKVALVAAAMLPALTGMSQRDSTLSMESTYQDERKLFLRDANKLSTTPQIKEQVVEMTTINYTTIPTRKTFTIVPQPITPAKVTVDEKLPFYYKGYVRAGFGSYNTVPVDIYYTDGRSKKGTYGVHYKLLRADGVVLNDKDSIPDRYSDNRAELWGKRFFNKFTLGGAFNWERNVTHWYGFDNARFTDAQVSMDSLRQRLNTFGGNAFFETFIRDSTQWNYNFGLALRNTQDLFQAKETNFDLQSKAFRKINREFYTAEIGLNYNTFNYFGPQMDGKGNYAYQGQAIENRSWDNGILRFGGTAQTDWKGLHAKAGAGIYFDLRDTDRPARAYPIAEVSYNIAGGIVVPYVGVTGATTPTTYLSLYRENPFINTFPRLKNLNNRLNAYGGIGGSVSRAVSYKAGVSYNKYENFAYFINDSIYSGLATTADMRNLRSAGNKFAVVYDDLNVFNIFGELSLYKGEKWKANVRGDYYKYETGREAHAWNQPGLKFTGSGQYKLKEKFYVNLDLFFIGERWAKANTLVAGVTEDTKLADGSYQFRLKPYFDMNLRVEYRYNKRLSLWAQASNALALKYQRYSAYPSQQLLAMMGATLAF